MSRKSEEEIQAIMEEYRDAPMVTPLVRVPEQMSFTEKIGGTEYTVDAHFRKDGRDLLSKLTDIFMRGMQGYECYNDGDWSGDDGA